MRVLLLFSLLSMQTIAQSDTIHVARQLNYFPWLAARQYGDLPYYLLCDTKGIYILEEGHIDSFKISYYGKKGMQEIKLKGNQVPDSICKDIMLHGIGSDVFFSEIIVTIPSERMPVRVSSMRFTITRKEDE